MTAAFSPALSATKPGIGLRARHHVEIVDSRPDIGFIEIHAENYMGGGVPTFHLQRARELYPVSVHGVGSSLGSAGGIDTAHLGRLAELVARIEPHLVSEHLAWSGLPQRLVYLNDLLPLPYTDEALDAVAANVARVQEALRRPILIENPSQYLAYGDSPISEPEFLAELVRRTGCGILCDVNNIHVTCTNLGGDPLAYIDALPPDAVGEIHLAGHTAKRIDGVDLLIDDHGCRVAPAVWSLYERAVTRFRRAATLIEWDTDVPELAILTAEAAEADRRRVQVAAATGADDARAA
ncbi:MAG: DUF692 domain-containing protein [Gemmatimonas sp.]